MVRIRSSQQSSIHTHKIFANISFNLDTWDFPCHYSIVSHLSTVEAAVSYILIFSWLILSSYLCSIMNILRSFLAMEHYYLLEFSLHYHWQFYYSALDIGSCQYQNSFISHTANTFFHSRLSLLHHSIKGKFRTFLTALSVRDRSTLQLLLHLLYFCKVSQVC